MIEISTVLPVYLNSASIRVVYDRLVSVFEELNVAYEIIFVCDGSPDDSWEKIKELSESDLNVKGISLSRNFGQHAAITAGLENSSGNWVVVMDCDLQDRPEEIANLYENALNGSPIVIARRTSRQDGFMKIWLSRLFYRLFGFLTDTKQDPSIGNFGIYNHEVVSSILSMGDYIRFFPTMVQWVGFKKSYCDVAHDPRLHGESSYNLRSLVRLAINSCLSFSDKPLRLMVQGGLTISVITFLFAVVYLIRYFLGDIKVLGYASLVLSIWFLSGVIISLIGVTGVYIGRIFDQTKKRPIFIAQEKLNVDD